MPGSGKSTLGACNVMSETYPQYRWAALGILPIWTILTNAVVLCCFYHERSLRQNLSNFIIASMAVADVLLGIFVLPFAVYMKVVGCWGLGYALKVAWFCMDVLLSAASITNLLAITVYRYLAIAYPYRFRYSASRAHIRTLLVTAWSLAGALSLAVFIETMLSESASESNHRNESDHSCQDYMLGSVPFLVYGSLLSFFIPLFVMGFMAIRSIQLLKRQNLISSGLHKVLKMTLESSTAGPESELQMPDRKRNASRAETTGSQTRRKSLLDKTLTLKDIIRTKAAMMPQSSMFSTKEQRAIRTLLIVFGIFVVSWFPFFLLQLIVAWSDKDSELHKKADNLMFEFAWPGYVTSGINPIIYATVSLEFRKALKSIFLYKKNSNFISREPATGSLRLLARDSFSNTREASNYPSPSNHDPRPIKPRKLGVTFKSMDDAPPSKRRSPRNDADHNSILQVTQIE